MTEKEPIACTLGSADLEARLTAVRDAGRAALISHEHDRSGHHLRFRREPGIRERLEEIIRAERECCPFLNLTLEEHPGEIALSIGAPEGGEATAAALAATFETMAQ